MPKIISVELPAKESIVADASRRSPTFKHHVLVHVQHVLDCKIRNGRVHGLSDIFPVWLGRVDGTEPPEACRDGGHFYYGSKGWSGDLNLLHDSA